MPDNSAGRETQIGAQSRYLVEQLKKATDELGGLEERLDPALSQAPLVAGLEKRVEPEDRMAPHAIFLKEQGDIAKELADEMIALQQRVEL